MEIKSTLKIGLTFILGAAGGLGLWYTNEQSVERDLVILSTNDVHASIDRIPLLATAVKECRDTVATLLVDAGDRWTGNAYVDLAEGRRPILDLMNELGYDAATFGNHEFDCGPDFLDEAVRFLRFPVVCANFRDLKGGFKSVRPSLRVKTQNGLQVGIVGVVTNFDNGHPEGKPESFTTLEFPDAYQSVSKAASKLGGCNLKILLSHMGLEEDSKYASSLDSKVFDFIVGGHSHDIVDTLILVTPIHQTGSRLKNVGATRIHFKAGKPVSVSYENIPLSRYAPDEHFATMVEQAKNNPVLLEVVGELTTPLTKARLANLENEMIREAVGADISFYHYGGIRLEQMPAGPVIMATLYDNEPFYTEICTVEMTREDIRQMILAKYNDKGNIKESHRLDIFSPVPYDIVIGSQGDAVDVLLPTLQDGKTYKVAINSYMAATYPGIDRAAIKQTYLRVVDVMVDYFRKHSPVSCTLDLQQRELHR